MGKGGDKHFQTQEEKGHPGFSGYNREIQINM
jgi:hypothetical protein